VGGLGRGLGRGLGESVWRGKPTGRAESLVIINKCLCMFAYNSGTAGKIVSEFSW